MKQLLYSLVLLLGITACNCDCREQLPKPAISTPPAELQLDEFYKKYINVNGIHLISSHRVPDSALYAAYRTLDAMTGMLPPEVLKAMTDINTRVGVMARYERHHRHTRTRTSGQRQTTQLGCQGPGPGRYVKKPADHLCRRKHTLLSN